MGTSQTSAADTGDSLRGCGGGQTEVTVEGWRETAGMMNNDLRWLGRVSRRCRGERPCRYYLVQ